MPTRPDADLVPVRKETKKRLAALKRDGTYDAAIRDLLARADVAPPAPMERPRHPEEQVALAQLAARRWRMAVERGVLEELGPRLIVYRTGTRERRRPNVQRA